MIRTTSRGIQWTLRCGILILAGWTIGGCRSSNDNDGDSALVRLINASPRAQDLAVAVDGKRVWRHSTFRSNTGYAPVDAGTYKIAVEARQDGQIVSGGNVLTCDKGRLYTVMTLGQTGNSPPEVRIFGGEGSTPVPANQARVRFINAIVGGSGESDLLFNNIAGLTEVIYGRRSQPILLEPGAYDVKVNTAGEDATLAGPTSLRLKAGHAYTLVAMGQTDASGPQDGVSLELYPDDLPDTE